jgi:two-component system CheB/CheR fusion protein
MGPAVLLKPNAAATMGMVLFELANNAAKYGALKSATGRVELSWTVAGTDERHLTLSWRESGGPSVIEPAKAGFGTNFVERSLQYELGGKADFKFRPSGLECVLIAPLVGTIEGIARNGTAPDSS